MYGKRISDMTIIIKGLKNNHGKVFAHLFKVDTGFPKDSENAFVWDTASINGTTAIIYFYNIPYGTYALTSHHDENNNDKMDRNLLGMPTEGFGLSNNVKILFSVPDFEECSFSVDSSKKTIIIYTKYL